MIRIAVCDDDIELCANIEKILYKNFNGIYVESFFDSWLFIESFNHENFDIVVLDIVFEGKVAGINIGNDIRNKYKNDYTQIIYISSYDKYAISLFETRPLNFLVKPLNEEKLCSVINKALDLCNHSGRVLTLHTKKRTLRILYKDIIYITKNNRKLLIVTNDYIYEEYGKMSDINHEFLNNRFLQIHSSIIVNPIYVKAYYGTEVLMTNGDRLTISRPYQKKIKTMLMEDEV
jgi:DNA-binding LytR/AlgR family response regulator